MKKKTSVIATILVCGAFLFGCNNTDNNIQSNNNDEVVSTDNIESNVDENTYIIDISLDTKEHTFKIEDERPILEAFTEVHQRMSPQAVQDLFMNCGNITTSEIYTIEPSEYEMFDITVINNEQEEVTVTYKDGSIISKMYKKDTFDDSDRNMAFVNYESKLFNQEYSSGIYREVVGKNIAENKNVWEIEEELFKLFN